MYAIGGALAPGWAGVHVERPVGDRVLGRLSWGGKRASG